MRAGLPVQRDFRRAPPLRALLPGGCHLRGQEEPPRVHRLQQVHLLRQLHGCLPVQRDLRCLHDLRRHRRYPRGQGDLRLLRPLHRGPVRRRERGRDDRRADAAGLHRGDGGRARRGRYRLLRGAGGQGGRARGRPHDHQLLPGVLQHGAKALSAAHGQGQPHRLPDGGDGALPQEGAPGRKGCVHRPVHREEERGQALSAREGRGRGLRDHLRGARRHVRGEGRRSGGRRGGRCATGLRLRQELRDDRRRLRGGAAGARRGSVRHARLLSQVLRRGRVQEGAAHAARGQDQ